MVAVVSADDWSQPLQLLGRLGVSKLRTNVAVDGVDHVSGWIFTVTGGSSTVSVYSDRPPYSHVRDVKIEGLDNGTEVVACRKTGQLYIADMTHCVWVVKGSFQQQCEKWIPNEYV